MSAWNETERAELQADLEALRWRVQEVDELPIVDPDRRRDFLAGYEDAIARLEEQLA